MLLLGLLVATTNAIAYDEIADGTETSSRAASIIVLGDSLSAGYGIELKDAWPSLLQTRLLEAGRAVDVVNASISGETTKGGLKRVQKLLSTHHPSLVLVELGANDALRGVPAKHARKNLLAIVDKVIKAGAEVLLFEMIVPPNYGQAFALQYEKMYAEIGELDHVELVPFFLGGVIFAPDMMQADGLHPTALAQPILLEDVWPYIDEKLQALNLMVKPSKETDSKETCTYQADLPQTHACEELGEHNEFL